MIFFFLFKHLDILKADLVSIQSSEENDFVTELKGTHNPWIGGVINTSG